MFICHHRLKELSYLNGNCCKPARTLLHKHEINATSTNTNNNININNFRSTRTRQEE